MQMVVKSTTTPAGGTATTTTETLNFTYDASGTPMSVNFSGTDYYYVANIQGDVMAILNTSGNTVVEYAYDAWGNIHDVSGSLSETLGEANPLTYRGYVYDHEIGYYYLQSRYYDPEVGRFINADGYAATGCGILGNNMLTYCNNNPASCFDTSGQAPWPTTTVINDGGCTPIVNPFFWNDPSRPYYANISKDEARNAERRFLKGSCYVEYRDTKVFRVPFMGNAGFSCGYIFIGPDVTYDQGGIDTLRHEYGHVIQLQEIGILKYAEKILAPSVKGYWSDIPYEDYYSQSWEYLADLFGGVERPGYEYTPDAHQNAIVYWEEIING